MTWKQPALVALGTIIIVWLVFRPNGERPAPGPVSAASSVSPVVSPKPVVKLSAPIMVFREWFEDYSAAPTAEALELGKAYAKQHTQEIARLIQTDPQLAIESAVPMVMRQKLPREILMLLEDRVRVRADYEVYGNVPLEGQEATTEPYTRTITTKDGKRWNAHVYGKRQWQRSTSNASLNGVAVGREMAVSDSPLRVLEVGEVPESDGREVVEACPVSGIETEVDEAPDGTLTAVSEETPAFETPERVIYVCSGGHISQIAEKYLGEEEQQHWASLGTDLFAGTGTGPAHAPISGTIPGGWTLGNRTFLYIRACFPDNPVDPQNEQECIDMLKAANDYVVQTSYGRCYLTYAVAPLVVLPYPLEWYNRHDADNNGGGDHLVQNHAIQIAKSMGYDVAGYNLRAVRWSGGPGSYGGSASVGAAGMRMKTSNSGTFIHELGHNLGLWHANFWRTTPPSTTGPGNNLEYGNTFDVLGSSGSSGQFTASFKNTISWMPPEQFWNVTASGLYRIAQTDASIADPSQRYAIRVRRDVERDFWAEFRLRHTSNVGFTNGLMMTFDRWGLSGIGGSGGAPLNGSNAGAQLLDMTPGSFGNGITDTRNDSALWVGRTFSDPDFKIHFTPVAKNSGTVPPSMDVQVQIGDVPGNNAPTLSVAASATSVSTGTNVTLTATATDPDGDTLAYAWVFDDGTYSTNNNAVQTRSWSTAGRYQVLCTASDMKGRQTTKSVLITVGSPTTFTVSGTITGPDSLPLEGVYVTNYAPSNNTNHGNSGTFRGTWTDSDGNYTLTGLAAGTFSITPNLYPLVFTAQSVTVGPSATGRNFTSTSLPAVTISYPDSVAAEGSTANAATIRLTREGSTVADLSVQIYNVNSGSATRTTDYTLSPAPSSATSPDGGSGTSQYIIPAGSATLDITLTPVNDSTAEGVEIASLDFVNTAQGYVMAGNPRAQISITDDDSSLPVVKITPVDDSGHEAGTDTLTMKVERNGPTTNALTVNFGYTGTATRNTDYTAPGSATLPAGSSSTIFTITPINDPDIETTETIICTISTNAAYIRDPVSANQSATSQLNDDDMPTVSITATDATASETGSEKGVFTITRTGATASSLTVDYGVNGRAVLGTDYRRLEGRAVIPAGLASTTVEIVPFDDALDEGTQDVVLQLRTSTGYFISPTAQTATVTIADNDASQVYIELNTGSGTEPASGSANGPVFQITRPSSGTAITVNYTITGTATSGSDFTALPGSITFASGDTSKTITVSMLADTAFEDAESVTMTLTTGTGYSALAGQNESATAWIYDGDQPTVEVNAADSTSGLTAPFSETTSAGEEFFISRRGSTTADLVVNYTMSGTALEGTDYNALSGSVTIPAGSAGAYVSVVPINDTTPEGVETIVMNLTPSPGTYGVRVGAATMLLGDNDNFSGISLGFAGTTASTAEDVGTHDIPVNLTGSPAGTVTVQYRVNGGTAAGNGIDFSLANGVLTFASGQTSQTIPVTIVADQLPEPAETIVVQLLNQTGANLSTSSHTLTINNRSMPEAFTDPASSILADGATLNGRVNPGGLATTYWFEYGSTTAYGSVTASQNIAASNTLTAVTFALTGATPTTHFRLVAQNAEGSTYGINQTFTVSNAPSVSTAAATNVAVTTATLNGTANSNGVTGTAWFEWGLTNAYGSTTTPQNLAATTNNIPLTSALTGLTQATTYFYRAVLQTSVGTVYGDETSFTTGTPLLVKTGSFTGAGQTGIVCDGFINPGNVSTDWWFEYGTDTNYGSQTAPQTVSGGTTQLVRFTLNDLTPGTEYHFRLVGQNGGGTTYGDDQTITTLETSPASIVEPAFVFTGTGTAPQAPLHLAPDGTLWGTTSTGGTYNRGTTFKMTPGGTLTTLASFYGSNNFADSGNGPNGSLVRAADSNFYGTTNTGGINNLGCIFRLTPAGEMTTLESFSGTTGAHLGSNPINGLTLGHDGALYGVAQNSNSGYIFKMTTGGVYTQLVAFTGTTGANLGSAPRGNLVLGSDGNFYGTTASGGSGGGFGTVFRMTPAGVLTTLVNFTGTTGANPGATPTSGLVQGADGDFYGMTSAGGSGTNLGTIFKVTPAGVHTVLVSFSGTTGAALGSAPKGTLVFGSDGLLYGTTTAGGNVSTGLGTVFKCTTTGVFTTLLNFSGSTGSTLGQSPNGGLVLHPNGEFYGTTSSGGVYGGGTIFKVATDGTLTTLVNCTPFPAMGRLTQHSNGRLYGVTNNGGGSTNVGLVFGMPVGGAPDILSVLTPVSGTTAWDARAGLVQASDGHLYGTAVAGAGSNTNGGIFRLTTAGVLTTLYSFSGSTGNNLGSAPRAPLIVGADGQLWGTTSASGTAANGTLFRTNLSGSQTTLMNLTGTSGANPGGNALSSLLLGSDGSYYGATSGGGNAGLGTIFKLTSGGTHSVLFHSTVTSGANPIGQLVQGTDGHLYGVTSAGGAFGFGAVFRCSTSGAYTLLASFTGASGALPGQGPSGGLTTGPDGHFYGLTTSGSPYASGTLFRVNRDGTIQSLYAFSGREDGISAAHGLATGTGALYGVTNTGAFRVNLPPVPMTLAASAVTSTSATLNGSVDANGESGSFWFEVNGTPTAAQSFTASSSTQNITVPINGLAPLQTYRVKAVITTSSGTFSSAEKNFTTLSTVHFASASDMPVVSHEYTASGMPGITLGFAPTTGQVLKLVSNNGFLPVNGTFANLPEGSLVTALNGSTPYTFEISYTGGDGNDITLTAVDEVITFPSIPVKYVGDAAFALNASSSGTSTVAYQIVAGGASASVSGDTITLTSTPGTVTVKATAGNALPKYQTFVLATAGTNLVQITMSKATENTLAVAANGTLWATGANANGQLGSGNTTALRVLTQIGTVTNWRQVSTGTDHTVATRTDGTLWAFGRNNNGQIGQGSTTTTQYTSPTQIGADTDWAWAVAGANHCVAVKTDGTLWAWGANGSGQCGRGNTTTPVTAPLQIGTATTWMQNGDGLCAGGDFTLALQTNGTLWAWGANTNGQLGDASTTTRSTAVQIGSLTTWNRVVAGTSFSLATRTDGTLWAWGLNTSGQLGDATVTQRTAPVQSGSFTDWDRIVCGTDFVVATRAGGTLWAWGRNQFGQLGRGMLDTLQQLSLPEQIGTRTGWLALGAGANAALAMREDGLHGWGHNNNGQISVLHRVARPLAHNFARVLMAASTNGQSYILREDGTIWATGHSVNGSLGSTSTITTGIPVQIGAGSTWKHIAAGTPNTTDAVFFAIRADGTLWGTGINTSGQVGDGSLINSTALKQIGSANDWSTIATSGSHAVALKQNGTLWAWGLNTSGQLGDGSLISRLSPVQIGAATDWASIAASGSHTLALKTNGSLWAWGLNSSGQLGDGTTTLRNAPVQIGSATDWTRVACGTSHSFAIKTNGTLWAWGSNGSQQLGDGTTTTRSAPVQIGTATNWRSIASSAAYSVATRTDGTLWSWGSSFVGRTGRANMVSSSTPTQIGASTVWGEVQPLQSTNHTLVTTADGRLWAFGWNAYGQTAFAGRQHFAPEVSAPLISNTAQTMTFTAPSSVAVGSTIPLNATSSSGLPARYIVTGNAALNGDQLTITGGGFVSVIAYQPGDSYWQASDLKHAHINLAAPTATTVAATNVTATSATLNATVNPNGATTTAQFQSGTSISYGTNTPVTLAAAGSTTAENVSVNLNGLTPGTTYHFRIHTSNLGGVVTGANMSFTTPSNNDALSNLTLSTGTLAPIFDSTTLNYSADVPVTTASVDLTAFSAHVNATMRCRNNGGTWTPLPRAVATAIPLETGLNNVQVESTAQDGTTQRIYSVQIIRAATFAQWSASQGITGSAKIGPMDDFDGDNFPNIIEYAFGMPGASGAGTGSLVIHGSTLTATGQPVTRKIQPPGGGAPQWCAIYIRRKDHVQTGLIYTPTFSADLSSWDSSMETPTILADDGIYQAVCVPCPEVNGQPAKFFKLNVTLAP